MNKFAFWTGTVQFIQIESLKIMVYTKFDNFNYMQNIRSVTLNDILENLALNYDLTIKLDTYLQIQIIDQQL